MNYDNNQIIQYLDSATISALFRVYGIKYDAIGMRLRCTRQNIVYKMKTDSWKDYERQMVLELLRQHGLETVELILINRMVNTSKNLKQGREMK
ncbi:hypothetical protein ACE198_14695 [Neobacillus sp. KR4-4]|uniref:hypothetical protein n=1 Tax=Neobacillus sp. KR4-4 TaxID=3344872 RepID=UPI0035CBB181